MPTPYIGLKKQKDLKITPLDGWIPLVVGDLLQMNLLDIQ